MKQTHTTLKIYSELRSLREATTLALKDSQYTYGKLTITCSKQMQAIEAISEKIASAKSSMSMLEKNLKRKKERMMKLKSRVNIMKKDNNCCSCTSGKNTKFREAKTIFSGNDINFQNFFRISNKNKNQTTTSIVGSHKTPPRRVSAITTNDTYSSTTSSMTDTYSDDDEQQELLVDFCTSKERRRRRCRLLLEDLESVIAIRDITILELERQMTDLLDRLKEKNPD